MQGQSSVWRASVVRHADRLVEDLSAMCERAAVRGSSELVDLNRALTRAIRIRRVIRKRSGKQKVWEIVRRMLRVLVIGYDVLLFVKDVARTIHSLLCNCTHSNEWSIIICCIFQPTSSNAQAENPEYPRYLALV